MLINTNTHLSDWSDSISFDKKNTIFSNNKEINTIQDVVEMFNKISIGGNDKATKTTTGIVKLTGNGNSDVVTSRFFIGKSLNEKATEKNIGVVKLHTMKDVGNSNLEYVVTPKTFSDYLISRVSTSTSLGITRYSTQQEIDSRNGSSLVSPKDLRYSMNTMIKKEEPATEKEYGIVKIVNVNDLYGKAKDYDDGYVISPKTFSLSRSTETRKGIVKFSKNWDDTININDTLTPKSFNTFKSNIEKYNREYNSLNANFDDSKKIFSDEAERIAKEMVENKKKEMLDSIMGIGDISIVSSAKDTKYMKSLNGQSLIVKDHKELFEIIGYEYGGSGDRFNLPDARGMMLKMQGKGSLISGPLGNIKAYNVGDFVKQGVAPHKHAGFGFRMWRRYRDYRNGRKYVYDVPDEYRNSGGLWKTGMTKEGWYHGSRTSLSKGCVLRYGDNGSQHGTGTDNEDTRPWNISFNFMIRVA